MSDGPAYRRWQEESTRLMRLEQVSAGDLAAIVSIGNDAWAELNADRGGWRQRAERAEREESRLLALCRKLQDRLSESEAERKSMRMDLDEQAMGDDW